MKLFENSFFKVFDKKNILCLGFGNSGLKAIPLVEIWYAASYSFRPHFCGTYLLVITQAGWQPGEMWTCGFLHRWKKGWSYELSFLVYLNIQMQVYHSELYICDCRDTWDLHSVLWAKFIRSVLRRNVGRDYWWRASVLLLPPRSQLWFLAVTCTVAPAFFRGILLQQCSWKAEFLIREYSRAIDFVFLNKESGVAEFFAHLIEKADFQRWLLNSICASETHTPPSHRKCAVLHSDKLIKSNFLERR